MRTKHIDKHSARFIFGLFMMFALLFANLSATPSVAAEALPNDAASISVIKMVLNKLEGQPDSNSITLGINGKEYKATLGELRKLCGYDSPSSQTKGSDSSDIYRNITRNSNKSEQTVPDAATASSQVLSETLKNINKGGSSVQIYVNDELIGSIDPENLAPYKDVESAKNALIEEYLKRNTNINSKNMSIKTVTRGGGNISTRVSTGSREIINQSTNDSATETPSPKIQIDPEMINAVINKTLALTLPNTKGQNFTYGENGAYIGALLQSGETDIPENMSWWAVTYIKTAILNGFGARFEGGGYSFTNFTDFRQPLNKANLGYLLARALHSAKPGFDFSRVQKYAFDDAVQDNYSRAIIINGEERGVEEIVHSLDILKSVSDTSFGGKLPVSRWQLALSSVIMLSLAGNSVEPSSLAVLDKFTDIADMTEDVKKVIAFVVENGYMEGVGDTRFLPFSDATLEQGVRVATKAFETLATGDKIVRPIEITSHMDGASLSGNVLLAWRDPNRVDGAEINTGVNRNMQISVSDLGDLGGLSGAMEDIFRDFASNISKNRSVFAQNMATRYTVTVYSEGQSVFRNETTELSQEIPADVINAGKRLQITVSSSDVSSRSIAGMAKTALLNCFSPNAYFNRAIRSGDKVILYWRPIEGAVRYEADLTWARITGETVRNAFKTIAIEGIETSLAFDYAHNTSYNVTLRAYNAAGAQLSPTDSISLYQGRAQIPAKVVRYETREKIEANLKSISVPIWRMDGKGVKTSSKANIQIHKDIADVVVKIFDEIYNGPEKFPIKDVGGYSWRGDDSNSRHKYGLAIDINSNENYMPSRNVGSYWRPYDDPFSITPDGDVVRAFEKYGFTWGSEADSMHFEY